MKKPVIVLAIISVLVIVSTSAIGCRQQLPPFPPTPAPTPASPLVPAPAQVPEPSSASTPTESAPVAAPAEPAAIHYPSLEALSLTPAETVALEQARANIPKIRQATVNILLSDSRGKPLPGIAVRIEQSQHRFQFGGQPNEWQRAVLNKAEQTVYEERFFALFNQVVWGFNWRSYEPTRGTTRQEAADRALQWAAAHGASVKGHALIWTQDLPDWFTAIADKEDQVRLAEARVRDLARRHLGRVTIWDVVNEAKNTFSLTEMRRGQQLFASLSESDVKGIVDYADQAFRWARESDPDAVLLINDTGMVSGKHLVKVESILQEMKRRNTPFDGVGLQAHMKDEGLTPLDRFHDNLTRLSQYGRLYLTELSVPWQPQRPGEVYLAQTWAGWSADTQAAYTVALYTIAFGHSAVDGIVYWPFTDRRADPLTASTGLLREDLSPRPAYEQLKKLIREVWWTRWEGQTDRDAAVNLSAFYGDYILAAMLPEGKSVKTTFRVDKDTKVVRLSLP